MANIWNKVWLWSASKHHKHFVNNLHQVEKIQENILLNYLKSNKNTYYGKKYNFGKISCREDFQSIVPIIEDYSDIAIYIKDISTGKSNVLTSDKVLFFENTSGSTSLEKWIPYTRSLKIEFQKSIAVWMNELNFKEPAVFKGPAYWSLSPALKPSLITEGGLRIGMTDDSEYFNPITKRILSKIMAVKDIEPNQPADQFYMKTCLQLLSCGDLSFISIWSPNFLITLDSFINIHWQELKKQANRPLPEQFSWQEVFPDLSLISCWTDAQASMWLTQLKSIFGPISIQPKGLLSTEGVVSTPTRWGNLLSYTSHYYEFKSVAESEIRFAHNLEMGQLYEVIISTAGGLYRYNTHDVVKCDGFIQQSPLLTFMGRSHSNSDMVGEKISEMQIIQINTDIKKQYEEVEAIIFQPKMIANKAFYEISIYQNSIRNEDLIKLKILNLLNHNPYYNQAIGNGQLGPPIFNMLQPQQLLRLLESYKDIFQIIDGNAKLPVLLPINLVN